MARRMLLYAPLLVALCLSGTVAGKIDRRSVVSRFNPVRVASSSSTPMQVGNGDFAFGADVTGLQTFLPWAIMSSWGWKNDSLPEGKTWEDVENYKGETWDFHGRPLQIEFGGEPTIQQWLIANPNRVNLGRVGLLFRDESGKMVDVAEADLGEVHQELDLWSGILTSQFTYDGERVTVKTFSAQSSSTVGVTIDSPLVRRGRIGVFLDFPWNDGSQKFSAPFVGWFNMTRRHTTALSTNSTLGRNVQARINHTMESNVFFTSVGGSPFIITRDSPDTHSYSLFPKRPSTSFSLAISYSLQEPLSIPQVDAIEDESTSAWEQFWSSNGFIDVMTGSSDSRAEELQRRIVLSRYLMRVNEAGDLPPQESGLVNNGWYGKFHMEQTWWHLAHWALWGDWDILDKPLQAYSRFLQSSIQRAQIQEGFASGARWSKMTDPSGRSAPGEINELLIWQQPHPLVFAEYEYRATGSRNTLEKWRDVVTETANWMSVFAWRNASTGLYDLGPPMYVVSEDTSPNVTRNPAFELAYWRFGLQLAETWMKRLGAEVPRAWEEVRTQLAPLPIENGLYAVFEGLEADFWTDPAFTNDHPAMVGLHGWLPLVPGVNATTAKLTADKVFTSWNISNCWGWDFPMLAMSAARNGETDKAMEWLMHPLFEFDDVGMPVGGVRVPTPYFPGSGALLLAVAMMAEGWDDSRSLAPGFPSKGWIVRTEGISKAL